MSTPTNIIIDEEVHTWSEIVFITARFSGVWWCEVRYLFFMYLARANIMIEFSGYWWIRFTVIRFCDWYIMSFYSWRQISFLVSRMTQFCQHSFCENRCEGMCVSSWLFKVSSVIYKLQDAWKEIWRNLEFTKYTLESVIIQHINMNSLVTVD